MRRAWWIALLLGCDGPALWPDAALDDTPRDAATSAPALRNPVALPDAELALAALQIMGAQVPGAAPSSCNHCHGLTDQRLRYWRALTDTAFATCFTDLAVSSRASARAMVDCMRAMPELATSDFQTRKLGVFAAAASLPWFDYTFEVAYGADAAGELSAVQGQAGMPREGTPWTQAQFDVVAEWFLRGLPALDQTLVTPPPPPSCSPAIATEVATHVATMATQGWRAVNAGNALAMHGCGSATDPRDCLQSYPLASGQAYGVGWEVTGRGSIRVLADNTYVTLYWTRSSADGRFVAHGVADVPGSYVLDLQRAVKVPIAADYDPAFFPDHSGFVFQGGPRNTCSIAVLTSSPSAITMTEPGCRAIGQVGLYQHLGRLLGGGDLFAIDSVFVSDDGGKLPTLRDPDAAFGFDSAVSLSPLLFDGTQFVPRAAVMVATPFEGDAVLSPSARLVMTRLAGPADRQLGYVLRAVDASFTGSTYAITLPERARYCVTGGKPAFSYDERWIVFHHYVGASDAVELGFSGTGDPGFVPYLARGAANLYLLDLVTGAVTRITNMAPGQYALFPHFRSDGWIYAQARDATTKHEYTIALDAALVLE